MDSRDLGYRQGDAGKGAACEKGARSGAGFDGIETGAENADGAENSTRSAENSVKNSLSSADNSIDAKRQGIALHALRFKLGKAALLAKYGRYDRIAKKLRGANDVFVAHPLRMALMRASGLYPTLHYDFIWQRTHATGGKTLSTIFHMLDIHKGTTPINPRSFRSALTSWHGRVDYLLIDRYFGFDNFAHLREKTRLLHQLRDPVEIIKCLINAQILTIAGSLPRSATIEAKRRLIATYVSKNRDLVPNITQGSSALCARAFRPCLVVFIRDLVGERLLPTVHEIASFLGRDDSLLQENIKEIEAGAAFNRAFPMRVEYEGVEYLVALSGQSLPSSLTEGSSYNIYADRVYKGYQKIGILDTSDMESAHEKYKTLDIFVRGTPNAPSKIDEKSYIYIYADTGETKTAA